MNPDSEDASAASSNDPGASKSEEPARNDADLLGLLECEIEPVRKSPLYFVGSSIVAIAMVILPLLYVGLVALACYVTYLHATRGTVILTADEDFRIRALAYFGPLIVGGVVALFMIKPLFARRPTRPPPYSLDPRDQPVLFEYTRRLSRLTRSPAPRRIDVDCEVNASASFRRGWRSMFTNDLVLTIGLPLADGMTLRQLTGVLAHEFGHFSQGGAMRLSYVIRSVSFWFARVVYERDNLDIALDKAIAGEGPWFWKLILAVARGAVWLTRRILWAFMTVGQVISSFLLRQMEYDADRHQARIAGSEEFEKTFYRMTMLSIGQQIASEDLRHFWEDRKLPDRLPELVTANADLLAEETRRNAWESALARRTGRFDTHPADFDRIRSVHRENATGVVKDETPARRLFENYPELTLSVTKDVYRNTFEIETSEKMFIPTGELLKIRDVYAAGMWALRRFYCGLFHPLEPVFPNREGNAAPATRQQLIEEIERVRWDMSHLPNTEAQTKRQFVRRRFELGLHTLRSEHTAGERAEMESDLKEEAIGEKIEFLENFEPHFNNVIRLCHERQRLLRMLTEFESRKGESAYVKELLEVAANCMSVLYELKRGLQDVEYPYVDVEKSTCASIVFEGPFPPTDNIAAVAQVSGYCAECLVRLYTRVIAELAFAAESVETAIGLPPLSGPPSSEPARREGSEPTDSAETTPAP